MSVSDAAKLLHMNEQQVREMMKRNLLPIGICYKGQGERWVYKIYTEWLDKWLKGEPVRVEVNRCGRTQNELSGLY